MGYKEKHKYMDLCCYFANGLSNIYETYFYSDKS